MAFIERPMYNSLPETISTDLSTQFVSLLVEKRSVVPTDCAAFHLNRKPQTLRLWAMSGSGPIDPLRINGRLAWPVAEIKRLLGLA